MTDDIYQLRRELELADARIDDLERELTIVRSCLQNRTEEINDIWIQRSLLEVELTRCQERSKRLEAVLNPPLPDKIPDEEFYGPSYNQPED